MVLDRHNNCCTPDVHMRTVASSHYSDRCSDPEFSCYCVSLLPAVNQINIISVNVTANIVLTQMLRYIYDAVIWNVDQYQEDKDRLFFVT